MGIHSDQGSAWNSLYSILEASMIVLLLKLRRNFRYISSGRPCSSRYKLRGPPSQKKKIFGLYPFFELVFSQNMEITKTMQLFRTVMAWNLLYNCYSFCVSFCLFFCSPALQENTNKK